MYTFQNAALAPRFASFYETASADRVLQYLVAFLVLLSTVKLWHLFRINPKINIFTATLARAWSDMSGFLLIVGLLLVAYASAVSGDGGAKGSRFFTSVQGRREGGQTGKDSGGSCA